ncbi:hypothetical protein [Mesorhizobium carmichaelinearum]|uniref:hypothetical protein n=1 Tax=Mesorhizobium carmichaelinearum TaxID=1208188 RepID=UPI000BA3474A|nr:hypothetical protein [Mesorhizobium carmichaelinearum]
MQKPIWRGRRGIRYADQLRNPDGALLVAPAAAEDMQCPKGIQLETDIKAAPDCLAAHKLHQACAWESSGDEFMSEDVIDKCEAGFLDRLTAKQKRLYQKRIGACSDRYPVTEEGGSIQIYLSWMCDEDLAATYFKAAKGGQIVGTPRWRVPNVSQ